MQTQSNVFLVQPDAAAAWAVGVRYAIGDEVTYNGRTYRCRQAHVSQSDWAPATTLALWQPL